MNKRLTLAIALLISSRALAGGYEYPDNGTEAMGRGATFTAKADSPLALLYNVGGLARQRGTRLEVDMNFAFQKLDFQRAGVYPGDPTDPLTPWAGQPFPKVSNKGGMMFAPGLYLSSDFHYFERWTFGIGLFGPSSIGNRDFGKTVTAPNGMVYPGPGRYDILGTDLLIFYPTLGAAVRATKWLSIGVGIHLVFADLDLRSTSITDTGNGTCPTPEYKPCDATLELKVKALTATASLGVHITPIKAIAIGLNLRGPAYLNASGKAHSVSPDFLGGMPQEPAKVTFKTNLPWVLRMGGRYIFWKDDFERGDIELDVTYESWKMAQDPGPKLNIPALSLFTNINAQIYHKYRDTFSVRLGGAFNQKLPAGVLTVRAGAYYDRGATSNENTRINFDTLDKIGLTLGLGYKWRGLIINVAYAYIHSPDRHVTNGQLRPINSAGAADFGTGQDRPTGGTELYPAVNNGLYQVATHVASLGLQFWIEDFFTKKKRVLKYE